MHLTQAESFMRMLADESSGEAWFPKFESAFTGVMQGVFQSFDSQYRLLYTPQVPANQKFYKIKVEAFHVVNGKRQDFKVRARAGWRLREVIEKLRSLSFQGAAGDKKSRKPFLFLYRARFLASLGMTVFRIVFRQPTGVGWEECTAVSVREVRSRRFLE
jgi:hypothetical protein